MKKKSKKTAVKKSDDHAWVEQDNSKPYHILMYVLDSTPKLKRFETIQEMGRFIDKFNKKYPESEASNSGNWTDLAITYIKGEVHFFTDGMELE